MPPPTRGASLATSRWSRNHREMWGRMLARPLDPRTFATALHLLRAEIRGFSLVAILSLALGIGANTALFQLLHAVRLRSLPVPHTPKSSSRFSIADMTGGPWQFRTGTRASPTRSGKQIRKIASRPCAACSHGAPRSSISPKEGRPAWRAGCGSPARSSTCSACARRQDVC